MKLYYIPIQIYPIYLTTSQITSNLLRTSVEEGILLFTYLYSLLQLRNLSVGLGEESCIVFTQENSMENSLQDLSLLIYFSFWSIL